jgi:hypothetical protein
MSQSINIIVNNLIEVMNWFYIVKGMWYIRRLCYFWSTVSAVRLYWIWICFCQIIYSWLKLDFAHYQSISLCSYFHTSFSIKFLLKFHTKELATEISSTASIWSGFWTHRGLIVLSRSTEYTSWVAILI